MSSDPQQGRPTTIADNGPAAAPNSATLSGPEQHAFAAMKALDAAAEAVEAHAGPRAGAEYEAKVDAWRKRYAEWRQAMRRYAKSIRTETEAA
jgi:hypothetical protein